MTNFQLSPIENEGKRVLTTAQLAEAYGTTNKVISDNFNNNKSRYTEGKHFYHLTGDELKTFKNYSENFGVVDKRTPSLYLWTEKGALLHAKSLNTDKAWEVYDYLVESYFTKKTDYSGLSPQLQYLITLEQKTKELETAVHNTNKKLDSVCDTIQVTTDNWRKKTHMLINKLATAKGMEQRLIYLDIYDELENRAGVNLARRYDNLIDRLYERGASNSVINRTNYIDVIAEDKKLIEIYTSIVKEWFIRYGECGKE